MFFKYKIVKIKVYTYSFKHNKPGDLFKDYASWGEEERYFIQRTFLGFYTQFYNKNMGMGWQRDPSDSCSYDRLDIAKSELKLLKREFEDV